jgi:hypothetical protein
VFGSSFIAISFFPFGKVKKWLSLAKLLGIYIFFGVRLKRSRFFFQNKDLKKGNPSFFE